MLRAIFQPTRFLFAAAAQLLRFMTKGTTVLLLISMLAINVASLTVDTFNGHISGLIETVSNIKTLRGKTRVELDRARVRVSQLDAAARKARAEVDIARKQKLSLEANLNKAKAELAVEKTKATILAQKTGKLEVENGRLRKAGPDVVFRGKSRPLRDVIEETAQSVGKRTAKVAAVNVGSMAGEGIPFWGIAVIVASTAYEVNGACETMKDMRDFTTALSPGSADDGDVARVCGMHVPNKEELWQAIKASPGVAWDAARESFPDLPTPDLSGVWASVAEKLSWK